jgi:Flp pilus assembly protein CpaB
MAAKIQSIRPFRSARQAYLAPTLALCCVAICISYVYVSTRNVPSPLVERASLSAEYETVKVPVPTQEVPAGTRIRDIELFYTDIPRYKLPRDTISNVAEVSEWVSIGTLPPSMPLVRTSFLAADGSTNALIDRIPPGMRAMTLNVDETSAVEGWASSGAIVDVLLIQNDRTSVVAEKVKILSAERSMQPSDSPQGEAPAVPKTVTILVTQEQCLAISTAMAHGKIAFALRSNRDDETWSSNSRSYLADRLKDGGALGADTPKKIGGFITVGEKRFALIDDRWVAADHIATPFTPTPRQEDLTITE